MTDVLLYPTEAEIRDMPAVLLVGARDSGKSRTLLGWSTLTTVFEVSRPMDGPMTVNRILQAAPTAFRSSSVREYVVGDLPGRRLRVIDLPGEALETTEARRAENLPTASEQYLADLVRLDPLVGGVLVCSAAPQGSGGGFVPDFDLAKVQMHERPPNAEAVKRRLEWALGFTHTFLLSPNVRRLTRRRLQVAVQVNFADLIQWEGPGLASIKECVSAILPDDAPEFGWRAIARRRRAYSSLSDTSLRLLPWLAEVLDQHDSLSPFAYVQANEPMVHAPGLLGGWARLTGFLYLVDQTLGRKQQRQWWLRLGVAGLALVLALIGAAALWAKHWADTSPETLPFGFAVSSCGDLDNVRASRCGCAGVLMGQNVFRDFPTRARALGLYAEACRGHSSPMHTRRVATALLHAALAAPLGKPDAYDPERILEMLKDGAAPGSGPAASPWYPAVTEGQAAVMRWFLALATKQPDSHGVPTLTGADATQFPELAGLLATAKASRPCLEAWQLARAARAGKPDWAAVQLECASLAHRLPAGVRACLAADLPPPTSAASAGRAGKQRTTLPRASAEVHWPAWVDCTPSDLCRADGRLNEVLFPAPEPNVRTFAALAFRAPDLARARACVERAQKVGSVDPAAWSWLALLSSRGEDRMSEVVRASASELVAGKRFLESRCKKSANGNALQCTLSGAGSPVLVPLEHGSEAACNLAGVATSFDLDMLALPWREPIGFTSLANDSVEARRAELALSLMRLLSPDSAKERRGCRLLASLTGLRTPGAATNNGLWAALDESANGFPKGDSLTPRVRSLHCEATARLGRPEACLQDAKAFSGLKLELEARRCLVLGVLQGLERGLATDALLAEDSPLDAATADRLRILRDSCRAGSVPCQAEPGVVENVRKHLQAQAVSIESVVLDKQPEAAP